jgi:uncharacterized membrane protein
MQPHEDPQYYKLGMLYYNPADNRFIIPKRSGLGWSFNFANYWSWLVAAVIVGILIWGVTP